MSTDSIKKKNIDLNFMKYQKNVARAVLLLKNSTEILLKNTKR